MLCYLVVSMSSGEFNFERKIRSLFLGLSVCGGAFIRKNLLLSSLFEVIFFVYGIICD